MSADAGAPAFVSTGHLPARDRVQALVDDAYAHARDDDAGEVSRVYPALAEVPRGRFGICLAATSGAIFRAGDADHEHAIMSVSKPFMFALVCQRLGADAVRAHVGVNATGLPFDSAEAVERAPDGRTNPMVNAGALATTSLVAGATPDERWRTVQDGLSRFAGRALTLDARIYASAMETNQRNRQLARLLAARGRLALDPDEAVDLYTRQCALRVTAVDLAVMGATLADGGVNPVTHDAVIDADVCHHTLAVMATAGLYERSGDWLYDVGLPGKSGIGGGIVTVAPGKGGLGTFAPPLDAAGNSVKGQAVARRLSRTLGLDLLASRAGDVA